MTNLVERLRNPVGAREIAKADMVEAADEIERERMEAYIAEHYIEEPDDYF